MSLTHHWQLLLIIQFKAFFKTLYIFNNGNLSQKYIDQLYDHWYTIGNLKDDTDIQYVDSNTCGCNTNGAPLAAQTLNLSPASFKSDKAVSGRSYNEPQGAPELLTIN